MRALFSAGLAPPPAGKVVVRGSSKNGDALSEFPNGNAPAHEGFLERAIEVTRNAPWPRLEIE
jgi:hypothetical protein